MSITQFFRILWARRWLILTTTITCLVGAVLIAQLFPPRYEGKSRVMLDNFKPDPVTGEVMGQAFARAYVKTQIELIQDYRIAGKVVDALGWESSPDLAAAYARRDPSDTRDFRRWLAQRIMDNTDASLIETSNILEIRFVSFTPDNAARIADAIRDAYVDQSLAAKRSDAARNATFFREQAARIRSELTAAEKKKSDFERANGIILGDRDVDTDTARLTALASQAAAPQMTMQGGTSGPNAQLAAADAQLASAEKVLGPNNPELQNLRRQRDAIAAASKVTAPRAVQTGPSIGALYSAQEAKVLAQRGKVNEAQQLAADVAVLRDQYTKTSARAAELQTAGESDEAGLTPLGNAVPPDSPKFPNWPLIIFGSLGLGLALGVAIALIVELLGRRVRGMDDLKLPGVPVLGVMGKPTADPARRGIFSRIFRWRRAEPQAI